MDFPAALTLVGADPFLSEDEARRVREMLERDEQLMASLDAEIAQVKAALAELKEQRNMTQHNIASNYAPSESEALAIRAEIEENESRFRALEEEIAEAHEHLDALLGQRQQTVIDATLAPLASIDSPPSFLDTSISQSREAIRRLELERDTVHATLEIHRALLSPIRRMPLEIMAEIFVHCLPEELFVRPSPRTAPLLVAQVSKSWRQIALSAPGLWSSIAITIDKDCCRPHLPLIDTWISRSGTKPLAFRVDDKLSDVDLPLPEHRGDLVTGSIVLQKFHSVYSRWKHVCLTYTDWRVDEMPFTKFTEPPPLLESVSLSRQYWLGDMRDALRTILAGPNLRLVHWRGIIAGHPNPGEIMSVSTLRELHIENLITKEQFYTLLQSGPNLEDCNLNVFFSAPNSDSEMTVQIQLPRLTQLSVTTDRADSQLFDVINAPRLTSLTVQKLDGPSTIFLTDPGVRFWSQESFSNFVRRSGCRLCNLDLSDTDIEPGELLESLRMLSGTLENLALSNDHTNHSCVTDVVVRSLTSAQEALCPRLAIVKLWGCTSTTDGLVAEFLESRWDLRKLMLGVQPLSMAMVKFTDESRHLQDMPRLQALNAMRRGLTLIRARPGEVSSGYQNQ